jgi:hypothetical protein
MAEKEAELEELARRYLDLWQDQMSALAADPDFAAALQRLLPTLEVGVPRPGAEREGAAHHDGSRDEGQPDGAAPEGAAPDRDAGASGTAPAAVSPADRPVDLADLARRLGRIEARVAALEARARDDRAGP